MVRRMLGPEGMSATVLSVESGIPQPTLSRWLRGAVSIKGMPADKPKTPPSSQPSPKRPQDWDAMERAQVVVEASRVSGAELGELLRRKGLHREQLDEWRSALEEALQQPGRRRSRGDAQRIKELERELVRKDKALAETAALLVLKKKMAAIWGDEGDDTDDRNGK
jgi:hypothetical protein